MDVKTVCLGMLTDGNASGYDLKKQFESTFGHFFAAGYGSIYPALSALAREGLVDCREIPQEGRPDRKVYSITDAGIRRLHEALEDPCPCHKVRSEFLATICFSHLMSRDQVETVLDSRVRDADKNLQLFEEYEKTSMQDWPPGMRFVLGFGQAMMQCMKEYIEKNRHELLEDTRKNKRSAVV